MKMAPIRLASESSEGSRISTEFVLNRLQGQLYKKGDTITRIPPLGEAGFLNDEIMKARTISLRILTKSRYFSINIFFMLTNGSPWSTGFASMR